MKNFKEERPIAPAIFSLIFIFVFSIQQCLAEKRICKAIDVGSRKQLFIDNKFIAQSRGIELTMNTPAKTNQPILASDTPWAD